MELNMPAQPAIHFRDIVVAARSVSEASSTPPLTESPTTASTSLTSRDSIISMSHLDSGYVSGDNDEHQKSSKRTSSECMDLLRSGQCDDVEDEEILRLIEEGLVAPHSLEKTLKNSHRAVRLRRRLVGTAKSELNERSRGQGLAGLPWQHFDYDSVHGCCAENVIGYMPIPVGIAGPLNVDGCITPIPMATTEGTLIASTSRGCKALNASGGVRTECTGDAMTRAPTVKFDSIATAASAKRYLESPAGWTQMEQAFSSTTKHGRLESVGVRMAGPYLYLRFRAWTGEAMGMNMISKGVQRVLEDLQSTSLPQMEVVSLSGNYCTDKKPSAINWIEGRGKSVVAEAVIPSAVVERVLKTTVKEVTKLNILKNYVGSALAGTSSGGFNAHAANIVAAVFLATGQDAAQVTTSSNCITMMEETPTGDLHATVTMPSVEVGTVGGGSQLSAQASMLSLIDCERHTGEHYQKHEYGTKASRLACVIAAAVLAGELSLCCALASGDLVKAHMAHNRRPATAQ